MRTSWIHEEVILQDPVVGGLIASAVIGAGSSAYSANEQKKIAEQQASDLKEANDARDAEAKRIAKETRPDAVGVKSIKFGIDDTQMGSASDFIVPKVSSKSLGTSGTASFGLGGVV